MNLYFSLLILYIKGRTILDSVENNKWRHQEQLTLRIRCNMSMSKAWKKLSSLCAKLSTHSSHHVPFSKQSELIPQDAYSAAKSTLSEIKYYDKVTTNPSPVTTFITHTINLI